MPPLIGLGIVIAAVFGGFLLESGQLPVLLQPAEFVIIWGASAGSLLIAAPLPVIRRIVGRGRQVFRPSPYHSTLYLETLQLFYEFFQTARRVGMMQLERDIENPAESKLFQRYPSFLAQPPAVSFVCDTLRMAVSGGVSAGDLERLSESDLDSHEDHDLQPVQSLHTIADALPGLGIVAAVLGIVIAMSSLDGPPEELGRKVAAALVGTFLGVLTCYGFVSPLASAMEARGEAEAAYFRFLKTGTIAFLRGHPPLVAIEFARRVAPRDQRPTFVEMEESCRAARSNSA